MQHQQSCGSMNLIRVPSGAPESHQVDKQNNCASACFSNLLIIADNLILLLLLNAQRYNVPTLNYYCYYLDFAT